MITSIIISRRVLSRCLRQFAQWWLPEPAKCRVLAMDVRPGGAMVTEMSEDGEAFVLHMNACFLAVDEGKRIVFTNALVGGCVLQKSHS